MNNYPKVLYVEDDSVSRMVIEVVLGDVMSLSHFAIFADSYNFADRLQSLTFIPDIVLLDIHMEPINGFDVLHILRQHPDYQTQPVVALTASVMSDEVSLLKQSGFNSLIAKPIKEVTFPQQLMNILNGQEIWTIV